MKKTANGGGTVERRGKLWWVQVSLPVPVGSKAQRKRVPITGSENFTRSEAKRAGAKIAADVRAGRIVFDEKPSKGGAAPTAPIMTVRQMGEAWTSGRLYKEHGAVEGLSPRKSGYVDGITLAKHVYGVKTRGETGPAFGDLPVASVTVDDARAVMGAQRPGEQALQTRRHTYNRIRHVFDFAEFPLKLRADGSNPFGVRLRPRKVGGVDVSKDFTYWYPSEAVTVSARTEIPLARRVFYATAVATGFDVSTLPLLTWADYEPEHRTLHAVRPKVGKNVFVSGNPSWLFDMLDAWRELSEAPKADASREVLKAAPIFRAGVMGCRGGRETEALQADMHRAELPRASLYETTATTWRMRFHDLRATFETWARRAGWDQRDIDARTGHGSPEMAARYDRGARSLAELQEVPFPNLAHAIPEVRAVHQNRPRLHTPVAQSGGSATAASGEVSSPNVAILQGCEGGDLNPYANYGASTSS